VERTIEIPIKGMTCSACAQAIERALKKVEGVKEASVNLLTEKAIIIAEEPLKISRLLSVIRATGYDFGQRNLYLQIQEIDSELVRLIESKLLEIEGITEIKSDIIGKTLEIKYLSTIVEEEKILSSLKALGIKGEKYTETYQIEEEKKKAIRKIKRELIFSLIFTFPLFLGSMFHLPILGNGFVQFLLATPVQFIIGWRFHRNALIAFKHGSTNMNTLISIGTNAAYFYSLFGLLFQNGHHFYFETSAVIITLILFGRTLEEKAKERTSDAIKRLVEIQPKKATVIRDGKEKEISIQEVMPGDVVIIKQSEKIPVDGLILEGYGSVDESMITGESIPIDKSSGDRVIGGTLLRSGVLKVQAKAVGKESLLSQIIKLIEDAQKGKPPVQRLADKISSIFVPTVLLIAIITFSLWYFLQGELSIAIQNSIAVLIVACPCALGLATPTAIMVATGRAAREGILIRNIEKLEEAGNLNILFMDKTGTLTEGQPEVTRVDLFNIEKEELLYIVASAEKYSEHPLGKAILRYCAREGIYGREPLSFQIIPGGGIKAKVAIPNEWEKEVLIGSGKFMSKRGITLPEIGLNDPSTHVYVFFDDEIKGVFYISDTIRKEAFEIVESLKKMGIEVVILTGDNKEVTSYVAEKLGIRIYYSDMLPQEKARIVRKYRIEERKIVGMIGDGINDAPSFAEANIGIAMGSGTDIAIHAADITLMSGGLKGIPRLIRLNKLTLRTIKENLFWAFIYNVLSIPVAAGALYIFGGPLLNPMIASFAMSLSSVSVVTNSLRLRLRNI